MTSTNDGKDVKSNQTSGHKSKSYYIELYTSLEKALSGGGSLEERTAHVCEAWRRVYSLYQHSATSTHPHLLSWLQRHTANTVLQSKWAKSKNEQARLTNAIDTLVAEATAAATGREQYPWEKLLLQRAAWFRKAVENPWDNPVLKSLINPNSEPVTDQQVLEWLIAEHGIVLVTRLQRMVCAGNCDDLALLLASAVMDRARAATPHRADDTPDERAEVEDPSSFVAVLEREASFTADEWEMLTDIELVLLLKTDKHPRCIELAKLTPLRHGYKMVERLRKRLEAYPRDKKLWKHAKDVATLVAQMVIARCMVLKSCAGAGRDALYWCARALARLVAGDALRSVSTALAAPAATARHLHTFTAALSAECKELKTDVIMKPFICELYVRAITAGMNELEQLKLNAAKESEARLYEQTLAGWFTQLGGRLTDSARLRAECVLTAFSVHPARKHYERVANTTPPPRLPQAQEQTPETTSEYGSWANDSRTQSNLVKTSETLQLKQSQQHQANVLSTAILTEGEALGLEPELCQDLAVLLSGPRVKTLSWDMDRDVLLENCRSYMEKTHGGTRAVTTELKFLNLHPDTYRHLPEEGDDESDLFYGIEKGYEHEVQWEEPEDIWQNAFLDPEQTESANDSEVDKEMKKKTKALSSEDDEDPLSNIAEAKKEKQKVSKEKSKEKRKKSHKRVESKDGSRERRKDKDKKTKKERKKDKSEQPTTGSLTSLLGMKVTKMSAKVQDGEKRVRKKKERRREPTTMFSYVSVTESDYDSQGKSSLVFEHDPNVLVDGVFSMDEIRSPERTVDSQKAIDNTNIIKNNTTVQSPVINDIKTRPISSPRVSTASEDSDVSRARSPALTPNQLGPRHVVSSKVKSSITKLLQFRKNKPQVRDVPRPPPPTTPTQSLVGMKIYQPEEVPKVYLSKKQSKQLDVLAKEVSDLFNEPSSSTVDYRAPETDKLQNQNLYNVQKYPQQYPLHKQNVHNKIQEHIEYTQHSPVRPAQQNMFSQSPTSDIHTNYSSPIKTPEHMRTHALNLTPQKPTMTHQLFHKSMQNLSTDTKYDTPKKPQLINDPNYFTLQHVKSNSSQLSPRIISNTCIKPPSQTPNIQQYSAPSKDNTKSPQTYSNYGKDTPKLQTNTSQMPVSKNDVIKHGQKQLSISIHNISEPGRCDVTKHMLQSQTAKPYSVITQKDANRSQTSINRNTTASRCLPVQHRERADKTPQKLNINDNFEEYLKELMSTITASNGHDKSRTIALNKDVKVTPVAPASAKRVDSVTPQCAKQLIQQKKTENALNTFSRRSYMHKNKQSENKVNLTDTVTLELNRSILDQKLTKAKCLKNEVTISRVGPNSQDQNVRKLGLPCSRLRKDCPVLSSILDSTEPLKIQTFSSTSQNTSVNLANREDADLLLLLRNQSILKPNVSTIETLPSDVTSGQTSSNPQIKVEIPSAHPGLVGTKVKNINVLDTSPLKTESEENKALDWKRVMDALIAQKTEPLGPKALDLVLEKDYKRHSHSSRSHSSDKHRGSGQTSHNKPDSKKREHHSSTASSSRKTNTGKHSDVPKKPREIIKKTTTERLRPEVQKHFTLAISKGVTQTTMVPNSDYDIDDLIDDDLRREIGEISSDEDAYNAQNAYLLKGKTQSNVPKTDTNLCKAANITKEKPHIVPKTIPKNESNTNIVDCNRRFTVTCPTGYPNVINKSSHPTHIENKPTRNPEMVLQHTATSTIITNQVAQDTANNIVSHIEASQFLSNVIPANVIIAAVPQPPVVVIRQDLVYDPYPTIRIHESQVNAELCTINQSMYALNAPNIAVYQTTQYAAPVINPVIIGNAMTTTNVSNAAAMGNDYDTPDYMKDKQDQDSISLEEAIRLTDDRSETPEISSKSPEAVIRLSSDRSQQPEISTNLDFNMNRNCERKVLSQVQEKHPSDVDKDSHLKKSPVSPMKTDVDRIKLKRQNLMNRKISHPGYHPPIPLTYTPLTKRVNLEKQLQQETPKNGIVKSNLKSIPNSSSDIEKCVVISTSVKSPQSEANNENIESTDGSSVKENQKTCRRIWLRSSNKILNKLSPVKVPRVSLKRNTIKLKVSEVTEKATNVESENKEAVKKTKRVSNRILNKVKLVKPATNETPTQEAAQQIVAEDNDLIDFEEALYGSIVLKTPITELGTANKEMPEYKNIMAEKKLGNAESSAIEVEAHKLLNSTEDTKVTPQSNRLEPNLVIEKLKSNLGDQLIIESSSVETPVKETKVIVIKNKNRTLLRNKSMIKKCIRSKESTPNKIIIKANKNTASPAIGSSVADKSNKLKPVVILNQKVIKPLPIGSPHVRVKTNKLVEQISAAADDNNKSKTVALDNEKGNETYLANQKVTKQPTIISSQPVIDENNEVNHKQKAASNKPVIKLATTASSPLNIEKVNKVLMGDEKIIKQTTTSGLSLEKPNTPTAADATKLSSAEDLPLDLDENDQSKTKRDGQRVIIQTGPTSDSSTTVQKVHGNDSSECNDVSSEIEIKNNQSQTLTTAPPLDNEKTYLPNDFSPNIVMQKKANTIVQSSRSAISSNSAKINARDTKFNDADLKPTQKLSPEVQKVHGNDSSDCNDVTSEIEIKNNQSQTLTTAPPLDNEKTYLPNDFSPNIVMQKKANTIVQSSRSAISSNSAKINARDTKFNDADLKPTQKLSPEVQKVHGNDSSDCNDVTSEIEVKNNQSQTLTTAPPLDSEKTYLPNDFSPNIVMQKKANTIVQSSRSAILLNSAKINARDTKFNEANFKPTQKRSPQINYALVEQKNNDDVIDISETDDVQSTTEILKSNFKDEITNKDQQIDAGESLSCQGNIDKVLKDDVAPKSDIIQENQHVQQLLNPKQSNLPEKLNANSKPDTPTHNLKRFEELKSLTAENTKRPKLTDTPNKEKQTFTKGDIKIEELPIVDSKNPYKKLVRISLPNGKVFRATITGRTEGGFDSLFTDPTMRSILASGLNDGKRYTVNYKQVCKANKANPNKILGTQIQDLNIEETKPSQAPVDTVNLISDDEDEVSAPPTRSFSTEFGKFTTNVDEETFTMHQNSFKQKCEVKMHREDIFKSNKTKPKRNMQSENSLLLTRNKSKLLANASAPVEATPTANIIPEVTKTEIATQALETPINTLAQANSTPNEDTANIIEIDDSSNDSIENTTPKVDGANVEPVKKLVELKSLLLHDLGVGIDANVTFPLPKEKAVNNLKSALLQDLGIATTADSVIDITADDEKEDEIATDSQKKNECLENHPVDVIQQNEENKVQVSIGTKKQKPVDDIIQNHEKDKTMLTKRQEQDNIQKCVVRLVKCDNLIKKYKHMKTMKKCYIKLERLNNFFLKATDKTEEINNEETDEMNQGNGEDLIDFDVEEPSSSPLLSRCPSLSILNNWDDDSQPLEIPYPSSPVMEIYDNILQLRNKHKTELVKDPEKLLSLTCDSEWTVTKFGYRVQEILLRPDIPTSENNIAPDCDNLMLSGVEKLVITFDAPKLVTITLKFLEDNPDVIYRLESMRSVRRTKTVKTSLNKLKRKTEELVSDSVASKISKLGTLALSSLNSCIKVLDRISFPNIEENMTVQPHVSSINIETNHIITDGLPKADTTIKLCTLALNSLNSCIKFLDRISFPNIEENMTVQPDASSINMETNHVITESIPKDDTPIKLGRLALNSLNSSIKVLDRISFPNIEENMTVEPDASSINIETNLIITESLPKADTTIKLGMLALNSSNSCIKVLDRISFPNIEENMTVQPDASSINIETNHVITESIPKDDTAIKLSTLALNSLNSCINILDRISFPNIEENMTMQVDASSITIETNHVITESLLKAMATTVDNTEGDTQIDDFVSSSDNENSELEESQTDLNRDEGTNSHLEETMLICPVVSNEILSKKIEDEYKQEMNITESSQLEKNKIYLYKNKGFSSPIIEVAHVHEESNSSEETVPIIDSDMNPTGKRAEKWMEESQDGNSKLDKCKTDLHLQFEKDEENNKECLSPTISVPLVNEDTNAYSEETVQFLNTDMTPTDNKTEEKYNEKTSQSGDSLDDIAKEQSEAAHCEVDLVTDECEQIKIAENTTTLANDTIRLVEKSISCVLSETYSCDKNVTKDNHEVESSSPLSTDVRVNVSNEEAATEIAHLVNSDRLHEIPIDEIHHDVYEVEVVDTHIDDGLKIVEKLQETSDEPGTVYNLDSSEMIHQNSVIKSPVFVDSKKIVFNYHDYTKQPKKKDVTTSSINCEVNNEEDLLTKECASETGDSTALNIDSKEDPCCEDTPKNCSEGRASENYPLKSNPECKYEFIQEDDLLTVKITNENNKDNNEAKTAFVGANNAEEESIASICSDDVDDDVDIKGFEFEDIYVFPLNRSASNSNNTSNDSVSLESNSENVNDTVQDDLHDIDFHVIEPEKTYSRKRRVGMWDIRIPAKKYRKGKNIDCFKQTATGMAELAYGKEYKRLLEYCSLVKFSYTRPFHKECVEVDDLMSNWPIKNINCDLPGDAVEAHLFVDLQDISSYQPDPIAQTFVEEINYEYDRTDATLENPLSEASEVNFSMGFGEGSGRVIQILKKGESNISAATLSDVKQSQPVFKSVDCNDVTTNKDDQIKKIRQHVNFMELRNKVRTFFKKTSVELKSDWLQNTKDSDFESKCYDRFFADEFPFDLCSLDYVKPLPINAIVQVVQVGQLPVSAAAQNPVTCDPRVTQVSDASPSQCSVDNSPNDDSQSEIKTEYTELTTADLTLPLQEYAQQNQAHLSSNDSNVELTEQTISLEMEIKAEESPEIKEEMPDIKEERGNSSDTDLHTLTNATPENMDYSFENNIAKSDASSAAYDSSEQHSSETFSQQRHQNGTTEKTNQIAHAMNAAGITTTPETVTNTRAHALVNILSQKIRQGSVNTTQTTTNTYSKTTSINAMALQQALAQILPPPLNQTSSSENNQSHSTSVGPQVLHIVQGKNASGNQITLVDNSQQSVISAPNATQVLHIVQNKNATPGQASNGTLTPQANSFSGLSLVDAGLQQGGNQLLHIVNTGNQKTASPGQLLKRVNLLTNLTNVQGSNEQKMVQFVCKSADGKAIQLNAPHQRSMVLRLQPIETPNVQTSATKAAESQEPSPSPTGSVSSKESASQQEIKSRSIYEENYAKFIQNSSSKTPGLEKSTSLPKFNQAFGKPVFQEGQKQAEGNNSHLPAVSANNENSDCPATDNTINLEHIRQISSPPLLLRKQPVVTSASQPNIVQQIKQTIAPMNIQTMHGGVIYTRQIPVNIGGGQTINLITVPSTELINDDSSKTQAQSNQGEIEPSIIKIVPQSQTTTSTESSQEESNNHASGSNENAQTPQPQPVLTQMRIKLPMLSKAPQMVPGARVVRPSFFQIQRNVIGGANQQVYQQLVLTAAPPLGQQTIRLPQAQASRPASKAPSESQSSSSESQMSTSTLEQLREFDMVLEQVKERSTVQPSTNSNNSSFKIHTTTSSDTTDGNGSSNCSTESTPQVLYSISNNQSLNVAYVNRKTTVTTPTTSSYVRSPDSSGIADSPTSTHVQLPHAVTTDSSPTEMSSQSKPAKVGSKSKSRPKSTSNPPNTLKLNSVPPKTSSQKPLEDEQTTQRILYILAEYKEQVENSPDKDKPAPRRRSNPPSNPGSSKRKKSSSSRRSGTRDMSPVHGEDTCRTMGSEDSSCGTSQGDCTESCLDSHSPQDSPRKVARKITFDQDITITQPRPQPQRNVIVADGQTITVARGTTGKPATAVLMPANYILPVSMVKGGQQIAIVTNRGPKLLTVGGEGGATNALLLQRLIGPAGLKPVLARPGVRHVRLPTAALHNFQAFNLATATTVQPPDSTASPTPGPTPPELIDTRATSSPWTDRDEVKPERGSSPEGSEPWNLPSSADAHDYTYEETVRTDNMDRTVLVVQKKDGSHRQHRLSHVSAAALRHKYAILEHELRLQKSLSEECEDLGVDSPSASELFPEAELLFAASPAHEHNQEHHSHTPQPLQSSIPQPDMDDQIATDHLIPREIDMSGLGDVGIVAVSEDGSATIALDQEEFARSHPNTTFHSEPTEGEVQPFTITGLKGRHITSTIFHSNSAPATVLMTAPQATVISQAPDHSVKYEIENMINSMPSSHNNDVNLSSVLVKDDGLTRFDNILTDSRELHLTNTTSAIVHSSGNATQVIRRVCYEDDKRERDARYLIDEPDNLIAGDDAKMIAEDSSRDATLESMADGDDDRSSPERHAELFWESNSASERSESRRPLDFSSDSDKCCKSPFDETNSTDSSGVGTHMRLDSVIKEARGRERSGSADGSSADDTHPPLRTYPPKRLYHPLEGGVERSLSGKTRAGERSPDLEVRRRASGRGVVKRGCHCCNGSPAPPKKRPRQRKPTLDFNATN